MKITPPNYLEAKWSESKLWLTPIISGIAMRSTKFVISCSDCQNERIISYTQAYNIAIKKSYSRDCKVCRVNQGVIKFTTNHLDKNRGKIKHNKVNNPYLSKRIFYSSLFFPVSDELKIERKVKYQSVRMIWFNKRMKEDKAFYCMKLIRDRVGQLIKGKIKLSKKLGCDRETFKTHIESQFKPGMTWENHGVYGWHIDHIYPLSIAIKEGIDSFKKACHYTNLQPLWAIDNLKKGNKVI